MKNMKKIPRAACGAVVGVAAALALAACGSPPGVYRIPIQQGNLLTQQMINDLEPGMTRDQVRFLLGTPLLADTFNDDRWDYIYRYKPAAFSDDVATEQRRLQLHFNNDRLSRITGDLRPQSGETAELTREKEREKTVVIPAAAPRRNTTAQSADRPARP